MENPSIPNSFVRPTSDNALLLFKIVEDEGYADVDSMVEAVALDSVHPGICRMCFTTTTRCEPDMRDGSCHNCEEPMVQSVGVLAEVC